ncbi:hypothetical protein [Streptomyces sp. NPDC001930]|uniref:hypothetical protein n=1 Tax=Streptomyces sp. NPDC001930 TaxID=3364625 RepID=UPI00367445F9
MTSTDHPLVPLRATRPAPVVFGAGAAIGVLGGMIGLGGAEFRLPLLISLFGFAALSAVILNKAMSLVVALVALPARLVAVPAADITARRPVARTPRTPSGSSACARPAPTPSQTFRDVAGRDSTVLLVAV